MDSLKRYKPLVAVAVALVIGVTAELASRPQGGCDNSLRYLGQGIVLLLLAFVGAAIAAAGAIVILIGALDGERRQYLGRNGGATLLAGIVLPIGMVLTPMVVPPAPCVEVPIWTAGADRARPSSAASGGSRRRGGRTCSPPEF